MGGRSEHNAAIRNSYWKWLLVVLEVHKEHFQYAFWIAALRQLRPPIIVPQTFQNQRTQNTSEHLRNWTFNRHPNDVSAAMFWARLVKIFIERATTTHNATIRGYRRFYVPVFVTGSLNWNVAAPVLLCLRTTIEGRLLNLSSVVLLLTWKWRNFFLLRCWRATNLITLRGRMGFCWRMQNTVTNWQISKSSKIIKTQSTAEQNVEFPGNLTSQCAKCEVGEIWSHKINTILHKRGRRHINCGTAQ